jgi:TonB-dependent SusC/RagA subfamily outer membrane receptor
MKKYGEKGRNGVVLIYLKGMKGTNALPKDVLYFVDGREMARDSVVQLNTDDIESITVLKGVQAQAQYGEKGRNGVILIALKHPGGEGEIPRGREEVRVGNGA